MIDRVTRVDRHDPVSERFPSGRLRVLGGRREQLTSGVWTCRARVYPGVSGSSTRRAEALGFFTEPHRESEVAEKPL